MGRMPFLSPNHVKALEETHSSDLVLSSSTTGLPMDGALILLQWLSDTSTSGLPKSVPVCFSNLKNLTEKNAYCLQTKYVAMKRSISQKPHSASICRYISTNLAAAFSSKIEWHHKTVLGCIIIQLLKHTA